MGNNLPNVQETVDHAYASNVSVCNMKVNVGTGFRMFLPSSPDAAQVCTTTQVWCQWVGSSPPVCHPHPTEPLPIRQVQRAVASAVCCL